MEVDIDYWGNDIKDTWRASSNDCCGDCATTPGCTNYVWYKGRCWLKNMRGPRGTLKGAIAGQLTSQCSPIEDNIDYDAPVIGQTQRPNAEACCGDCSANPACTLAVWYNGVCYLKPFGGNRIWKEGRRSVVPTGRNPNTNFKFANRCTFPIELYKRDTQICWLNPNQGCDANVWNENGIFRHTKSAQATLVEYTAKTDKLWYDIGNVPPGCGNGVSHADCLRRNGGQLGFNVPLSIQPLKYNNNPAKGHCKALKCLYDGCPEGYLYPGDNFKTHDCPSDEVMLVTFCP
ncbi:unnamed protein product [Aphanomyces euteiches]